MEWTFDHIAQVVPDIAAAVSFYTELVPGSTVLYQDATWAFVEAGGVKLAFVVRDEHPGHLAWRVSRAELVRQAEKYGKETKLHRDGTESFYIDGPCGQHIEIITFDGSNWETESSEEQGMKTS
jgi:catechol 2,3-dioxygenase-like lactoylglutathione lyase family enzyme